MNGKLRRVLTGARELESRLTEAFEQAARTVARPVSAQPLELISLACDELARNVHPAGRGRYVFPFNSVTVTFPAPTTEHQAPFHAICAGPPTLQERIIKRLASARCHDADVEVHVQFADVPDPAWPRPEFHITMARVERAAAPVPEMVPRIEIVITQGTADREAYAFGTLPIAIGRGTEVRDGRRQLVRINHVAFVENGDDVNQSVSRRHARIELDVQTKRPRVIDDNSAQGTAIIRGGRGIAVPRGSRGLTLQTDDEVAFGQARVRIRIEPAGPKGPASEDKTAGSKDPASEDRTEPGDFSPRVKDGISRTRRG
jgi:hypothetical protein